MEILEDLIYFSKYLIESTCIRNTPYIYTRGSNYFLDPLTVIFIITKSNGLIILIIFGYLYIYGTN